MRSKIMNDGSWIYPKDNMESFLRYFMTDNACDCVMNEINKKYLMPNEVTIVVTEQGPLGDPRTESRWYCMSGEGLTRYDIPIMEGVYYEIETGDYAIVRNVKRIRRRMTIYVSEIHSLTVDDAVYDEGNIFHYEQKMFSVARFVAHDDGENFVEYRVNK